MTKQAGTTDRSGASQRLREALTTMTQQKGSGISPPVLTATALCELAGISRNTLYRYHSDVVQALHETQQKYHPRPVDDRRVASQLRQDNAVLRERLAKLAALADHYFAAWQETRQLLQRRERELADVRRDSRVRVVSIAPEQRSG